MPAPREAGHQNVLSLRWLRQACCPDCRGRCSRNPSSHPRRRSRGRCYPCPSEAWGPSEASEASARNRRSGTPAGVEEAGAHRSPSLHRSALLASGWRRRGRWRRRFTAYHGFLTGRRRRWGWRRRRRGWLDRGQRRGRTTFVHTDLIAGALLVHPGHRHPLGRAVGLLAFRVQHGRETLHSLLVGCEGAHERRGHHSAEEDHLHFSLRCSFRGTTRLV